MDYTPRNVSVRSMRLNHGVGNFGTLLINNLYRFLQTLRIFI